MVEFDLDTVRGLAEFIVWLSNWNHRNEICTLLLGGMRFTVEGNS